MDRKRERMIEESCKKWSVWWVWKWSCFFNFWGRPWSSYPGMSHVWTPTAAVVLNSHSYNSIQWPSNHRNQYKKKKRRDNKRHWWVSTILSFSNCVVGPTCYSFDQPTTHSSYVVWNDKKTHRSPPPLSLFFFHSFHVRWEFFNLEKKKPKKKFVDCMHRTSHKCCSLSLSKKKKVFSNKIFKFKFGLDKVSWKIKLCLNLKILKVEHKYKLLLRVYFIVLFRMVSMIPLW